MLWGLVKFIIVCALGIGLQLGWLWLCALIPVPFPWGVVIWLGGYCVLALGWKGVRGGYSSDEDAGGL